MMKLQSKIILVKLSSGRIIFLQDCKKGRTQKEKTQHHLCDGKSTTA